MTKRTDKTNAGVIPSDTDLEKVVLGSLMLESTLIHSWIQDLNPNLFFNSETMQTCLVVLELYRENTSIDIITVSQKAREMKKDNLENDISILDKKIKRFHRLIKGNK